MSWFQSLNWWVNVIPLWYCREKKRVEARRSVSLSQADVIFYEGVVTASTPSNRMQSRSPHRPPPPANAATAPAAEDKYRDYYEKKYERPSSVVNNKQQGVDVDTVWKSRWRSTSPPPPLVDDWVPIKPPHLAWAKALPNESIEVTHHTTPVIIQLNHPLSRLGNLLVRLIISHLFNSCVGL